MGGRLRSYRVRTVYGTTLVEAETLFGDSKILLVPQEHMLVHNGKPVEVPAGVAYVHNSDRERVTDGKAGHLLVQGGLYDLARMCAHIRSGTTREAKDLSGRVADMRAAAHFLHVSGMMDGDERREILGRIAQLELAFAPPKRVAEKVSAAKHLGTARRLRESGSNRIAPSALTAHAAATDIERRIRDLFGHQEYFSGRLVRVVGYIVVNEQHVNALWEFLTDPLIRSTSKGCLVNAGPIQKVLELHAANFSQMKYRPFRDVAQAVVRCVDAFNRALAGRDRLQVATAHCVTIRSVRRLIMISHIERELIGRASVMAETFKRTRKPPHAQTVRALRDRLLRTLSRLNEMGENDLDLELLTNVRSALATAVKSLDSSFYFIVRSTLKHSIALLAGFTDISPVASSAA